MSRGATLERLRSWDEQLRSWDATGFRAPRWLRPLRRLDVRVFGTAQSDPTRHRAARRVAQALQTVPLLGFAIRLAVLGTWVGYLFVAFSTLLAVGMFAAAEKNHRDRVRQWMRANNRGS